jgi:predicted glycogen debranching enzyme
MREWLVANGLGGYSSLTNSFENNRKYHGLLVASLNPPTKRWVFVSNIFDKIVIEDKYYNLKDYWSKYCFDFFPKFQYDINNVEIQKTVLTENQKNTTLIKYKITTDKPIKIIHSPIINSRHIYDITGKNSFFFKINAIDDGVKISPNNIKNSVRILLKNSIYQPKNKWEDFYYEKDRIRKDSWIDGNFFMGDFHKNIKNSEEYFIVLTIEENSYERPFDLYNNELQRKKKILKNSKLPKKFEKLVLSSDNFIVKKGLNKSIVAGYHWFADWGRDTLISLPGLTLVTQRFDESKKILLSICGQLKNGLIPNAFMDRDSKAVYNTVDASLWFIDRVYQYFKYTRDIDFIKKIWPYMQSVIDNYQYGTDYLIHMDKDYLISHGEGLTWMDVKIGDYYPTPRANKAVEIQALWYNDLRIMEFFSKEIDKEDRYSKLSSNVKNSFNNQYIEQFDVIDKKDNSIRPNQIFLVSLDYSMINENLQKKIVDDVKNNLLTIFGLRTLSPNDSRYKGTYLGNYNRDLAYHNGTVWPWLLGQFIKAFVKTKNHETKSREYAFQNFLKPMLDVFGDKWDGSINEIFDGDPPFLPRGCISQAWSVAEILRCWVEDIENLKPNDEEIVLHEIGI